MEYLSRSRIEGPIWLEPPDVSFLRARIAEKDLLVKGIESQIDDLERQIADLRSQKDLVLGEIASVQSILAPVRKLPPEILSQIFIYFCHSKRGVQYDERILKHTSTITSVCAAWRSAAMGTASIWSKFFLSVDRSPNSYRAAPEWVKEWIFRSQSVPLDFHMNLPVTLNDELEQLLDCILCLHDRIRSLHLIVSRSLFSHLSQCLSDASLPLLVEISIEVLYSGRDDRRKYDTIFLAAPKLHLAEIKDPRMMPGSLLQCKNLTHLTLTELSAGDLLPNTPLLLPTVKVLDIWVHGHSLLPHLILPLLKDLTLRHDNRDRLWNFYEQLVQFRCDNASSNLSSLTLQGFGLAPGLSSPVYIPKIFALFPEIHTLQLSKVRDNQDLIFALLQYNNGGSAAFPQLGNLVLAWAPWMHNVRRDFCQQMSLMLHSRSNSSAVGILPLQELTLYGFDRHRFSELDLPVDLEVYFREFEDCPKNLQ